LVGGGLSQERAEQQKDMQTRRFARQKSSQRLFFSFH
jgi:hypothetical protein